MLAVYSMDGVSQLCSCTKGVTMSTPVIDDVCFLCGGEAKWHESERGNRRHYRCASPKCGEYEISLGAMERVAHSTKFKEGASAMAAQVKDPELILEIRMSDGMPKEITARPVKRRASLGGSA
jgi:hypothetical protein